MRKLFRVSLCILPLLITAPAKADEQWTFGIGTGLSALDVNGDGGFGTQLVGPIEFDASLKPNEVQEYMETALGFGLLAKKGNWTITASYANLELADDVSASQGNLTGELDITFETQVAELNAEYKFYQNGQHFVGGLVGARYTSQEYSADLSINDIEVFSGSVDDNWTDLLVGMAHTYAFSQTLSWSTRLEYGFGGSKTAHFNTGLNKLYSGNWLMRLSLDVKDIEYDEGDQTDADWFYYDAVETSLGLGFLYLF